MKKKKEQGTGHETYSNPTIDALIGVEEQIGKQKEKERNMERDSKPVTLDMISVKEEPHAKWADGTWFNETEVAQETEIEIAADEYNGDGAMFRFTCRNYWDGRKSVEHFPLCQSLNPLIIH